LEDSIERSAPTSFSIFPRSSKALLVDLHPGFLLSFFIGNRDEPPPKDAGERVEIDNLNHARKVQVDKDSKSIRAVANHDLLECAAPATSPSFRIDSRPNSSALSMAPV